MILFHVILSFSSSSLSCFLLNVYCQSCVPLCYNTLPHFVVSFIFHLKAPARAREREREQLQLRTEVLYLLVSLFQFTNILPQITCRNARQSEECFNNCLIIKKNNQKNVLTPVYCIITKVKTTEFGGQEYAHNGKSLSSKTNL